MRLLKKLVMADAPSGRENAIRDIIIGEAEKLGYEVKTDALGSVIAHKTGGGKKLMLDAHMDEIGVIAAYTEDSGFIRFGAVGGLEVKELHKRRVRFPNGVTGVIAAEDEKFEKKAELSGLYIDIGARDKAAAAELVSPGDTAVFDGGFVLGKDTVISKALDDRAGCYMLLKVMKKVKNSPNDLYFVFSVQEEVGLRGAKTAAFEVMPDYAIAVDVTDTGDTPSCKPMDVKLGGGAAIKVMDRSVMCDTHVTATLRSLAEQGGIPYQNEIMTEGGTDAGAIAVTGGGVRAGGVSLPTRYVHSPSEMASVEDIDSCISLLTAACMYKWE
ncbi:MAG: M42 family metallopeptidase [Clostridia bacterium]|nr:M42 family metallopeptidase [Clostridia bacterium]